MELEKIAASELFFDAISLLMNSLNDNDDNTELMFNNYPLLSEAQ